jgi:prepilin signal peptidase PulO-like enzyme (type II secretory pathway)
MKKAAQKPRKKPRHDEHCPHCGNDLGWLRLFQMFASFTLKDADGDLYEITCRHCKRPLLVEPVVGFTIHPDPEDPKNDE